MLESKVNTKIIPLFPFEIQFYPPPIVTMYFPEIDLNVIFLDQVASLQHVSRQFEQRGNVWYDSYV